MRYSVKILRAELTAVQVRLVQLENTQPVRVAPSEWAALQASLRERELDLRDAIEVLNSGVLA